jgi:hypothetical protein
VTDGAEPLTGWGPRRPTHRRVGVCKVPAILLIFSKLRYYRPLSKTGTTGEETKHK